MLPKVLYELLPYLYLSLGAGSGLVINSTLVLVGSFILIVAGMLIIAMRVTYRRKIRRLKRRY